MNIQEKHYINIQTRFIKKGYQHNKKKQLWKQINIKLSNTKQKPNKAVLPEGGGFNTFCEVSPEPELQGCGVDAGLNILGCGCEVTLAGLNIVGGVGGLAVDWEGLQGAALPVTGVGWYMFGC